MQSLAFITGPLVITHLFNFRKSLYFPVNLPLNMENQRGHRVID